MRSKLLIAGFMMALSLPATALAQPYDPGCVQQNNANRAAGTVLGGIGGALIGGAIGGRRSGGAGAVIGGVTGAVAGNAIAGSNNPECPPGYYYGPPPGGGGGGGFWYGAPQGLHERIDFMQDRINRASSRGVISPREAYDANQELNFIRSEDRRLHYQDGQYLAPQDRDYLQSRLDNLSQRLHWAQDAGY
ncbi:MAG TPA: hypothetical protein VHZ26_11625 [Caulobacteraceae bacterium]|nr:hypothetical protein [Caulobacteraceae bacterium]